MSADGGHFGQRSGSLNTILAVDHRWHVCYIGWLVSEEKILKHFPIGSYVKTMQYAHKFFHLGVHVPFYLHFWGYIKIFGGAILTLHLGVQRKLTAFSPRKVVHHAVFCKYYAELAKTFFSVWHWVRQEVGFCLTHGLCVCPTIFFVILYITCQILLFYTELNARLPIYSHDQ